MDEFSKDRVLLRELLYDEIYYNSMKVYIRINMFHSPIVVPSSLHPTPGHGKYHPATGHSCFVLIRID